MVHQKILWIPVFMLVISSGMLFAQQKPVYLDQSKPTDIRVADLISKMTLTEKVQQMAHNSPAIDRLNLPAYNWWSEALHGVARSGNATVFPQAIGLAATFDEDLAFRTADAVSDEARAIYQAAIKKDHRFRYGGLTFWTPNVNIFRDPRWGRGQETYGEDPYLTGRMGLNFVKGLQGNDPKYLKVAACAKHFAVHSGPERLRHEFNAVVSKKDLYETYLPAFKTLVDGGVESVMCAYNRTNSEPCCGSKELLVDILRNSWGFKGHVVSDCWAIADIDKGHKYTATPAESAALSLKKGVNLNCGDEYYPYLIDAVKQGLVTEKEIDASLAVLLRTRFKLGMFDDEGKNPYVSISPEVINSSKNRKIALEAAQKSIVMLKNNGVLPLENDIGYLFITGPNATSVDALMGNYYGVNQNMVTIQEGIAGHLAPGSLLQYKMGFLPDRENVNPIDWTSGDAKQADAIVVVMGLSGNLEGEEGESIASADYGDRLNFDLPNNQIEFLKKLRKDNTKPIVVVLTAGSPVKMSEISELADAVLWAWYPGEEGGNAVADVMFGKVSPSGRLPITFPKSLDQLPAYDNYNMKGRTYRYMEQEPFYPFGYGLSYSKFSCSGLKFSAQKITKSQSVQAEITVKNEGKIEGEEVVQLYLTREKGIAVSPLFSLKGFQRVHLKPGESKKLVFNLTPSLLSIVDELGIDKPESGKVKVFIGGSLPIQRSLELGMGKVAEGAIEIVD
jgi:beta-glucosidase